MLPLLTSVHVCVGSMDNLFDIHLSFFITTPFSSWKCYKLLHCLLIFPIFTFMPACKVVKNLF